MLSHLADLFAQRQFIRFWLARLFGTIANQMLMVAVAWHMYDITSSPWDLGLVGLFQFVPALVMTLPAGHVADRVHRGRIFAACMLTQGLMALLLVAATDGHFASRELILGISVVLGVCRAFQMPAQQALTPQLVPRELLPRAIALSSSGMEAAIIGGPALGGVLYVTGANTALAGGLALSVRYAHQRAANAAGWSGFFAGLGFVWQRKLILGATSLDLFAVLLGGATALLPIYARDILHTGPVGLGLLRAAPAIGALGMSLVLVRWPLERRVGPKLMGAVAVFGLATVAVAVAFNFINIPFMIMFFGIYAVFGAVMSLTAFFSRVQTRDLKLSPRDVAKALLLSLFEVTVLRFVLATTRMFALLGYRRNRGRWGSIKRQKIDVEN